MNVFEGDFASSDVINAGYEPTKLTYDQMGVIEEDRWELIQLAIKRGILPVEEAEVMLYEFHDRVQHLGNVGIQTS